MASSISSLGLGSGVLTSDVIDKLKAADTSALITPITNKITLQQQKNQAYTLLNSLLSTFQSSVNSLSDSTLYQGRTVSGNTNSVSVTANAGVNVQSFSISNIQMATNNVKESGSFTSSTSAISSGSGTMTLSAGGASFAVNYTNTMSLTDLKDAINSAAGSRIKASTLQVGTNDYRLVLTSADTGAAQTISISDSTGGTLDTKLLAYNATTNPTGMQEIQAAQDASFKYNGITLTRSSNSITDIIPGVTMNLLQNDTTSTANISISQDTQAVAAQMSTLVQSYNTLSSQLSDMTTSDATAGKVGIFNGDNSINSIRREITNLMTSVSNSGVSLTQYGIDLSETGTMSFNASTFNTKFQADPTGSETFFSNVSNGSTEDGVFTKLNALMTGYTGSNGTMANLSTGAANDLKALNDSKTKAQALLDARYATMTARFVQYDTMISQLTSSFSSLQQQITMATNGK